MSANQRVRRLVSSLTVLVLFFFGSSGSAEAQAQSPFRGSVPTGQASGTSLELTLGDAVERALQYNLGVIESGQNTRAAHATRLSRLNALLPNLSLRVNRAVQQINLEAQGLHGTAQGTSIPKLVGPFGVADARAYLSQEVFNWSDIKNLKSAAESERAAQHSYKSDRDLVVLTTCTAYLLVISDVATVETITAQVKSAQTLYDNDVDLHKQGVIARIDLLRAQVELQTQQQRLIAAENQLAIDKLALARVIGLPNGQQFQVTDSIPYAPLEGITLDQALAEAYSIRPDYLSAQARVRSATLAFQAAAAENYPSLSMATNYGDIGSPNFGTSHETFLVGVALEIPVFQGSRVRADKLQADSTLAQRKAELEDLGGKIDEEVRTAFFNLKSSSDLVAVAKSNIDLADQTLMQARDRFQAGVADNLEVVQAQESVASANQSYINSLYSFNLAKVSLAQAIGVAEQSGLKYLGVR